LLSPPWMMAMADRFYRIMHRDRYARRCRNGACDTADVSREGTGSDQSAS